MNEIMLINRLDAADKSSEKKRIFFIIGEMNKASTEDKLIDTLYNMNIIKSEDLILKYNGIELYITIQQIPWVIKELSKVGILIYSIYQTYDPD